RRHTRSKRDWSSDVCSSDLTRRGYFARFLGLVYRVVPKIGPLKPLSFKTPTPEAQKLFEESFNATRARYGAALDAVARGRIDVRSEERRVGKECRSREAAGH